MTTASPSPVGASYAERVQLYLQRTGLGRHCGLVQLTGDASDRRYIRVIPDDGGISIVLAVHASSIDLETLPFLNVGSLFRRIGVLVPGILDSAADLGILALEDLGDVTLQAHLRADAEVDARPLYREAIDIIVLIQQRGPLFAAEPFVPYSIAFDVEKLTWELNFFLKHFVVGHRGGSVDEGARAALAEEFSRIAEELVGEPRVLCHRDFHSRNLMLHRDRLVVIDFQDARLGPATYDLVSLLRDSYVELDQPFVDDMVEYFLQRTGCSPVDFHGRFDLMALQRNLKALGTFGYQVAVAHNPVYLEYVPRTLAYVRNNLRRHARRFGRLRDLLAAHLLELR